MKRYFILLLVSFFCLLEKSSFASPAELQHGLSRSEVITIMGPPLDKSERAVKGEQIWEYKNLTITFLDGLLVRWNRDDGQEVTEKVTPAKGAEQQGRHHNQSLTFQELLKNIPEEGASGNQAMAGIPGQVQPMQIQPMIDSPANMPPTGFPGGTSPGMSGLLEKLREQRGLPPQ
jgi:hypothetical protein